MNLIAFALLLIGFSLFSALTIALTHFRDRNYQHLRVAKRMGLVLMLALSGLQIAHFALLQFDLGWTSSLAYRITLFAVAPAFFLFSQPLLQPSGRPSLGPRAMPHALPILLAPLLPEGLALPLAFVIGAGYLLWLGRSLYRLRDERANFQWEMVLLGFVFAIAIGVSVLGFARDTLPAKFFFGLYAIAIGMAFFLVQLVLGLRPQLSVEISEAVQNAYANSTLKNVDCESALALLDQLMRVDRLYENADLSLPGLAERLGLSTHQLSELMNARLGKSFSRYLREVRVSAARSMLCGEPSASVLSVGLCVGFTSQSNFYEAFREIEGTTPGQYRRRYPGGLSR